MIEWPEQRKFNLVNIEQIFKDKSQYEFLQPDVQQTFHDNYSFGVLQPNGPPKLAPQSISVILNNSGTNFHSFFGSVNSNGSVAYGTTNGFTISKGSAGVYTINFTTQYKISWNVQTIACINGGTSGYINADHSGLSSCIVHTYNTSGVLTDLPFNFYTQCLM